MIIHYDDLVILHYLDRGYFEVMHDDLPSAFGWGPSEDAAIANLFETAGQFYPEKLPFVLRG